MTDHRPKLERPVTETLGRILGYLTPYRTRAGLTVVLMLLTSAAVLLAPALVRQAINDGIARRDEGALVRYSLMFLGVIVGEAVGLRLQMFNMIWIGQHTIMALRRDIFYKYLDLNMTYFDYHRVGDLMSRITEDSNAIERFITWGVINMISNVFTLLGIIILMLIFDWSLALLTFTVLPLMAGLTLWWRRLSAQRWRAAREAVGVVSATLQENLSGMRIVQAYVREYVERSRFSAVAAEEVRASLRADKLASLFMPGIDVISQLGVAIVIGVGGVRVLIGDLNAGTLVAFLLYVNLFFDPIRDLAMRLDQFQEAAAASERILAVLEAESDIQDNPNAKSLPKMEGAVEFRHVDFAYVKPARELIRAVDRADDDGRLPAPAPTPESDEPVQVLHDITLNVRPGETVALVGHTGAGNSSLVRLLGRFYEAQSGEILFDGHPIRSITIASLRGHMAWVPQDTGLFATTIRENLRYGRLDAPDEEITAAARETGAHEFIALLAKGYDTEVEEGGSRLSTGQRQLISFTRALLADPSIIILDEATSSVDTVTELQMQAGLRKLLEGRTAFVIAHRLSTIVRADQVIVMDHGQIIEHGTHEELLEARGHYYNLYTTQLEGQISE